MSEVDQAYTFFGAMPDTTSEYNRMAFVVRSIMAQQATTTLVIVRAVDGDTVDVQPMVAQVDGAGNAVDHGIIHGLPVWRLQGGNSAVVVVPTVGDIGLAVFASTDISNVKRAKEPTTPGSFRRFDWSDGIYLGGLLNAPAEQFVRMDSSGITITAADGQPVTINADSVVVNADTVSMSGDLTVTGSISSGAGSSFGGKAFDTHKHSGVQTGGGNTGNPV
jgi:phage baseplate assembly protein gpV